MATSTRTKTAPSTAGAAKKTASTARPIARPAARPTSRRKPAVVAKKQASPTASAAAPAAANPAPAAAPQAPAKVDKVKKPKLVRDSFTIPKAEYGAIEALKQRSVKMGLSPKKSELLRAGLMLLASLDDAGLSKALAAVPAIKTGRPKA
jgi:hypothetical protein